MRLDDRSKELIAVGASVTANCQSCLEYHVGKAQEYGVPLHEINEAVQVGKMVRRGAASKTDKLALNLIQDAPSSATATDQACGCGG